MGKKTYETMNGADERAIAVQDKPSGKPNRLNFSNPTQREAHIQAFLAWLPKVLHDAPGIRWDFLPSKVMGYLIKSVADSPDAIPIALAIGCAMNGLKNRTLFVYSSGLTRLIKLLRTHCDMKELVDLGFPDFFGGKKLES